MENLIKPIEKKSKISQLLRNKWINKYSITVFLFLLWMVFFDNTSWLVIRDLSKEIDKYENQLSYYQSEYVKNDGYYKKLMNNKSEKEKYARENYFMKKRNEEIFILVVDSAKVNTQAKKP